MRNAIEKKIDVFQTKCLKSILRMLWPNTVTFIRNEELINRPDWSQSQKLSEFGAGDG